MVETRDRVRGLHLHAVASVEQEGVIVHHHLAPAPGAGAPARRAHLPPAAPRPHHLLARRHATGKVPTP